MKRESDPEAVLDLIATVLGDQFDDATDIKAPPRHAEAAPSVVSELVADRWEGVAFMHVVVQHQITDPESFFAHSVEEVAQNAPPGVRARQFIVSQDKTAAVCLWEADSVDALRSYMDPLTGAASENTYFEVDAETSVGLPKDGAINLDLGASTPQ